jgi:hypothetical protein
MTAALALLLAVGTATWLDVPFIRQPKDGCGSASIWMVAHYWRAAQVDSVTVIHREVFSAKAGGVYASDMQRYFATHGFDEFAFSGQWGDLREHLARGRPLIVSLEGNSRGVPLHYVVIAGIDEEQQMVLFNDAAERKLRMMRRDEFERRWRFSNNWTLLVTPRFEPASAEPAANPTDVPVSKSREDLERASEAFRREDYSEAKRLVRKALRTEPQAPIANDLLATLYILDNNLEAALKYWNRLDKPRIRDVRIDPPVAVDPIRLDRTFAFSRSSLLRLDEYRRTVARLDATRAFAHYDFELSPADADSFDLTFRAADRSGPAYLSWFAGLPFETFQPKATNIAGSFVNLNGMARWDNVKRRAYLAVSGPMGSSVSTRYSVEVDARREEWDIDGRRSIVRRAEATFALNSLAGSKARWSSGVIVAAPGLGYAGSANIDLVRRPERRLFVSAGTRVKAKRIGDIAFGRAEVDAMLNWLPQARGSDFATSVILRAGSASRQTPFDELFELGIGRDSDLLLRGHSTTHQGRKGAGVLARRYALLNLESEKIVREFTLLRVSVAPFVDVARTARTFVDAGVELRLRLASLATFSISIGKDLRTGKTVVGAVYR